MERNNLFLAIPPKGYKCVYDLGNGELKGIGKYFVEITGELTGELNNIPICKIISVIEAPYDYIVKHEIGKELFFIVERQDPDSLLKEIL